MSVKNYKYSDEQIQVLRTVSMHDILASLGYNTEHTSSNLYYSPFRNERTPSFHINEATHQWCDHGSAALGKEGGDTISLVQKLKKCSFYDALEYLSTFTPSIVRNPADEVISASKGASFAGSGISIEKAFNSFTSRMLLDYAVGKRCIPQSLLERYCSQVTYRNTYVDRATGEVKKNFHYAVGFRHADGSWTLRVPPVEGSKFKGKLSTGSNHTIILGDGTVPVEEGNKTPDIRPSSRTVAVFEGFFDYLSWMAWTGKDVPGNIDVVVLNGVTNTRNAMPFLLSHENVVAFLDNDVKSKTGERFTDFMQEQCRKSTEEGHRVLFRNNSSAFAGYKDVGDAWTAECAKRRQAAIERREMEALQKKLDSQTPGESEGRHLK